MQEKINGDAIKLGRQSRYMSQTEFAKRMGVSQSNLSKIEDGSVILKDKKIPKLCEVLNYPESFFREYPIVVYPVISWIGGDSYC